MLDSLVATLGEGNRSADQVATVGGQLRQSTKLLQAARRMTEFAA